MGGVMGQEYRDANAAIQRLDGLEPIMQAVQRVVFVRQYRPWSTQFETAQCCEVAERDIDSQLCRRWMAVLGSRK